MIQSPELPLKRDRLSAFFEAFALSARVMVPGERRTPANLLVYGTRGGGPTRIVFCARGTENAPARGVLVAAAVDIGGAANPLVEAMPERFAVDLAAAPPLAALAGAFVSEALGTRCGRHAALNRLCEVMVLMILRQAIDTGAARPGLLAGLSHPSLHRAIVAMHDAPARDWRVEDLAALAGMSRSTFMVQFRDVVGMTPSAYLTRWRLTLARTELSRGARVKTVASRVGFGSAAAFSRAYSRAYGHAPVAMRQPRPSSIGLTQ